ncbi:hypothetical protein [Cellulosimicrobium protaetiae]|uniref:PQQ-binding-like beta-propeller repeat protein n=1 Tax=Cellulosimicrobium protaetiae TaxID=2587808 RepID=A0A6M5UA74_9MICO|nr:hypothetical protein [Cellulosimicrobium protaetiae]QJW35417.1 hypothetical protein FIC82_003570 [Cellulosimicrobium protaetiae]
MPPRRRDARARLTFELVESPHEHALDEDDAWAVGPAPTRSADAHAARATTPSGPVPGGPRDLDDADLAAGSGTEPDDEPGSDGGDRDGAPPARPRRGRRAVVVGAVSAGLVLVLGGMAAVDAWHGRADLERLRTAPGGIEPIAETPSELWTTDLVLGNGLGFLPGAIVTVEDGAAVAVSLDGGEERWRVDVGAHAVCGSPFFWSLPSGEPEARIVCLAPVVEHAAGEPLAEADLPVDPTTGRIDASAWSVTVLDEDGEVLGRRDTTDEGGLPAPGPGGSLVRTERVGEVPAGDGAVVEQDPATGEVTDLPEGRPAVVRVEDALTGEVRWEAELPFVPRTGQCITWSEADGAETVTAELESVWTASDARLVRVEGCGLSAWFTPEGTRLDEVDNPSDSVVALPDGTFSRDPAGNEFGWGGTAGTDVSAAPAILDADGSVRWEPPGAVLVPTATDGRAAPLLVQDGQDVVAFDDEGTELWRTPEVGSSAQVRAVAGGTVVLSNGYGSSVLAGLDTATGRQRWVLDEAATPLLPGSRGDGGWGIDAAYTDGVRVVVSVTDWDAGRTVLTALDLVDGAVAWQTELANDDGAAWTVPVQGRLLRADDTTLARIG